MGANSTRLLARLDVWLILSIRLLLLVLVLILNIGCLLISVRILVSSSKSIILMRVIVNYHAVLFAFCKLFNIETNLLCEKFGQLLVDPVASCKVRCQLVRTIALIDMNILILSIANLNCNC